MNNTFDNHIVGTGGTGIIKIFDDSTNQNYIFAPAQIHGCMK